MYGHVITNFLGWVDLLTHGVPQARFARQSSAIIFADQVFIDPTFFGIFVCGPLQSLVVNVCTSLVCLWADGWKVARSVNGHLITKFSKMDRFSKLWDPGSA